MGITLSNVILPFDPGDMLTGGVREVQSAFNPADFPCPPCTRLLSDDWYFYSPGNIITTYGPLIVPPSSQFYSLVPEWKACSCAFNSYEGRDPPSALIRGSGVGPKTTTVAPMITASDPATGPTALPETAPATSPSSASPSTLLPLDHTVTVQLSSLSSPKPTSNSADPTLPPPNTQSVVFSADQATTTPKSVVQPLQASAASQQAATISTQGLLSYLLVSSQTLVAGGDPVTVSSQVLSLNPSGSVLGVGGSLVTLASQVQPATDTTDSDGQTISATSASRYLVSGLTLIPVASPIAISEVPAATTMIFTHTPSQRQVFTVGDSLITAQAASDFLIGGSTLMPGGPAVTIAGTPVSIDPAGANVVVGSSTLPLHAAATMTIGSSTIVANQAGNFIIAGQTLAPGSSAITVSGTSISLQPSGLNAIVDGTTLALATNLAHVMTIGSNTITANAANNFLIAGQTLSPGGPALTISGTPISLPTSGPSAVINGSTLALGSAPQVLTIAGQALTVSAGNGYLIDGQTLEPGQPGITVEGTVMSLVGGGSGTGIASLIMSGLGGGSQTGSAVGGNYSGPVFEGRGCRGLGFSGWVMGICWGVAVLVAWR